METSDENKRNCWLIMRVYLIGSCGNCKVYVLETDCSCCGLGMVNDIYVNKRGVYVH
jgi:hypothetical protein